VVVGRCRWAGGRCAKRWGHDRYGGYARRRVGVGARITGAQVTGLPVGGGVRGGGDMAYVVARGVVGGYALRC